MIFLLIILSNRLKIFFSSRLQEYTLDDLYRDFCLIPKFITLQLKNIVSFIPLEELPIHTPLLFPMKFNILKFCNSKFELSYFEAKIQFEKDVLLNENYYNGIINCRIGKAPRIFLEQYYNNKDDG